MIRTTATAPRRILAFAAVFLAFSTLAIGSADRSGSLEPNTKSYSTLAQCQAGMRAYQSSWTKITKSCTYAGPMFLWMKTASGPYQFVYTSI